MTESKLPIDSSEIPEEDGFVPLYRKIRNEIFYQDSAYVHLWIEILLRANHKRGYFKFHELNAGQFYCSRKTLARDTGIDESKVQRILKYLEEKGYIEQQMHSSGRVITIPSWRRYNNSEQQVNSKRTAREQLVNTNNNDNNKKNDNNIASPKSKSKPVLFQNFKYYEKELWVKECFIRLQWSETKALDYWNKAENYSNKGNAYIDWFKAVGLWDKKNSVAEEAPKEKSIMERYNEQMKEKYNGTLL